MDDLGAGGRVVKENTRSLDKSFSRKHKTSDHDP